MFRPVLQFLSPALANWLKPALHYIPRWLEFQMRHHAQPGCVIAVAHRGRIVLEQAFGHADLGRKLPLTPRHRFRVASHSKSFTSAGILKLRERRKLQLDDPVGRYVAGLHPAIAKATLAQLLSHSAGIVRDGSDSGQWVDRRPFVDEAELRAALKAPPILESNSRFKYSNHGYGLAGLVIEAVAGEPYLSWIKREIIDPAGLEETTPDMPLRRGTPFARGHSGVLPLGRRVVIPGENRTNAVASATGFVSTAADLARHFANLSPTARKSVLSVASRREMVRRQWRDPHSSFERYYGLGVMSGTLGTPGGWDWFGHSGGLQGYVTRTSTVPSMELTVSVLTNAIDGLAHFWHDGVLHILRAFAQNGTLSRNASVWTGRWWSMWGAVDLVPMGRKVLVAVPALFNPFADASELEVGSRSEGRIALANGFANHGEPARLVRNARGRATELHLGGGRLLPEARVSKEMEARYGKGR